MTEKERMLAGKLYCLSGGNNADLLADFKRARRLTREYNATTEDETERRSRLLKELLGSVGKNCYVEPNFRCDYGSNIHIGNHFYANFDCIILDVARVDIGDNVFFAPRVNLYTAAHPIDAEIRNAGLEYAKPITIGSGVWMGGGVIVNPGVTIGDNTVIGSGAVVTKDVPSNVVAAGNPCRVIRKITEEDKAYWGRLRDEYTASLAD